MPLDKSGHINPGVRFVGIALNTSALNETDATATIKRTADEHGLPCVDPIRTGVGSIVDAMEESCS